MPYSPLHLYFRRPTNLTGCPSTMRPTGSTAKKAWKKNQARKIKVASTSNNNATRCLENTKVPVLPCVQFKIYIYIYILYINTHQDVYAVSTCGKQQGRKTCVDIFNHLAQMSQTCTTECVIRNYVQVFLKKYYLK